MYQCWLGRKEGKAGKEPTDRGLASSPSESGQGQATIEALRRPLPNHVKFFGKRDFSGRANTRSVYETRLYWLRKLLSLSLTNFRIHTRFVFRLRSLRLTAERKPNEPNEALFFDRFEEFCLWQAGGGFAQLYAHSDWRMNVANNARSSRKRKRRCFVSETLSSPVVQFGKLKRAFA